MSRLTRDGWPNLSLEAKFSGARGQEKNIFITAASVLNFLKKNMISDIRLVVMSVPATVFQN